jgi:leader peptidase (prepilin peptidase) / N-methyltransferase
VPFRRPAGNAPVAMNELRYPNLVLALSGVVAAAGSIWLVPGAAGWLGGGLALLMLAIAATDLRHLIIPNELTLAALVLAIFNAALGDPSSIAEDVATALSRGLATMLAFLALRAIHGWLRHTEGIGIGDIKLAFVAGAWLDWVMIPVSIEMAALAALAAYVTRQAIARRPIDAAVKLPFGLFFAPSIWLSWLLGASILGPG